MFSKGFPAIIGRKRLRELVTMTGITDEQQEELFDLVLHMNDDNLDKIRIRCEVYQKQGAKFVYPDRKGKL